MKQIKATDKKWCKEQDKKFPPPRELCTHCIEWLYQDDGVVVTLFIDEIVGELKKS